jgi:hypothetical protein
VVPLLSSCPSSRLSRLAQLAAFLSFIFQFHHPRFSASFLLPALVNF